jgi:hypothetical protein
VFVTREQKGEDNTKFIAYKDLETVCFLGNENDTTFKDLDTFSKRNKNATAFLVKRQSNNSQYNPVILIVRYCLFILFVYIHLILPQVT